MRCPECGRKDCCGAYMAPHIEKLESLLLRIVQKHDRTLQKVRDSQGIAGCYEVPEVVEARKYLDSVATPPQTEGEREKTKKWVIRHMLPAEVECEHRSLGNFEDAYITWYNSAGGIETAMQYFDTEKEALIQLLDEATEVVTYCEVRLSNTAEQEVQSE